MLSSKAMKLMGLGGAGRNGKHPSHQIASRALDKNWCLLVDDYYEFWAGLDKDPAAATALLCELLDKVMKIEERGLEKIHKSLAAPSSMRSTCVTICQCVRHINCTHDSLYRTLTVSRRMPANTCKLCVSGVSIGLNARRSKLAGR